MSRNHFFEERDPGPAAQRGTAMGGFHLAGSLGFMLGPLIGVGMISTLRALGWQPYPGVFVLMGGLEALVVLVFLPWLLRLHRASGRVMPPVAIPPAAHVHGASLPRVMRDRQTGSKK
jgi:MFS family permease